MTTASHDQGEPTAEDVRASDLTAIARGGSLNMVGAVANGLFSFALVVVVTRGLGAAGVGAFFSAVALFNIMSNVAQLGADTGLVRTIARYRALGRTADVRATLLVALVPVVVGGAVFAGAMFLFAPQLADLVGKGARHDDIAGYARVLAPFLPLTAAYLVVLAATRGFGTMAPTVFIEKIGRTALQPLLALAVFAAGLGPGGLALAWAGPAALAAALAARSLWSLLRQDDRQPAPTPPRPRRDLAVRFWRFTAPRGFAGVFQVTVLWLDTLLIGGLVSTRQAGIYAATTRYMTAGLFAGAAIQQVMGPKISEVLARRDRPRAAAVYQTSTAWLMLAAWPIYLSLATFAPVLLGIFGREFVAGQTVLVILAVTMLVASGVGAVDVVLLMGGKSIWNLANTVTSLTLNLVLNLLLIPRLGITGAAIAWSVSILVNNLAPLAQVWAFLRLHPFGAAFARAALSALACYGFLGLVVRFTLGGSLPTLILYEVAAGVLYLLVLFRFRVPLQLATFGQALRRRPAARG
ncbi:MAG: polysaccharide biosynthesis C-terminal domain-containing protein [Actinomycetota bacterium]